MDDQKILELIAITPKCRAIQLADKLDAPLDDVHASLAGLAAVGDVVVSDGFAPNGLKCKVYDLSEKFKRSDDYGPIAKKAAASAFGAPGLSRVDRAIAFVQERGVATSSELHAVMGLDANEFASSYLVSATRNGRLVKEGKNWTLGPALATMEAAGPEVAKAAAATIPAAPTRQEAMVSAAPTAITQPEETPKAARRASAAPTKVAVPAPMKVATSTTLTTATTSHYRCALWSDGLIEVQCDGETVAEMPQEAGESLAAFMARVMGGRLLESALTGGQAG
jgi:hypothetical protein